MLILPSTRFGALAVPETAAIDFPSGLIGLPAKRYVLLAPRAGAPFAWLHSVDHPEIAIPVTDPRHSFETFRLALSEVDMSRIGTHDMADLEVYATVRVDGAEGVFTANLRAPIVVAGAVGHQVINHASGASLRTPLRLGPKMAA